MAETDSPDGDLPRPPSALPPPSDVLQERLDALTAEVRSLKNLDALVWGDRFRRWWGYAFYAVGTWLPVRSICLLQEQASKLTDAIASQATSVVAQAPAAAAQAAPTAAQGASTVKPAALMALTEHSVAVWIFYAAPVVASLLMGAACFAAAYRLQLRTDAVEKIELRKAGDAKKGSTSLQVELPKAFKLNSDSE